MQALRSFDLIFFVNDFSLLEEKTVFVDDCVEMVVGFCYVVDYVKALDC